MTVFCSHVALRSPFGGGGDGEARLENGIICGGEGYNRAALGADEGVLGRSSFSWIRGDSRRGL